MESWSIVLESRNSQSRFLETKTWVSWVFREREAKYFFTFPWNFLDKIIRSLSWFCYSFHTEIWSIFPRIKFQMATLSHCFLFAESRQTQGFGNLRHQWSGEEIGTYALSPKGQAGFYPNKQTAWPPSESQTWLLR